jgi:hypothetical protein
MSRESEHSPVKPTVIDLDPDQVVDDARPAAESSAPQAPPARTSRPGWILPGVALLAGAVGGGWFYRDVLANYLPNDQMTVVTEHITALQKNDEGVFARLDTADRLAMQLKTDVDALESNATVLQGDATSLKADIATTRSTMAALEQALAETKAAVAELAARPVGTSSQASPQGLPADVTVRLANLEKEVAALKAAGDTANQDAVALAQALSDLKAKVEAGTGFAPEQDRIARMVPAAPGLDVLAAHAAAGLPNAQGLANELVAIKLELPAPAADAAPAGEPGLWDSFVDMLSSIVTIRDADSENWQVTADKAIALVETGDIAQALSVLDEAEGTMPPELRQWRDKAAARIALEQAVTSVADAVTRTVAAGQ